jgi:hypothetical protein
MSRLRGMIDAVTQGWPDKVAKQYLGVRMARQAASIEKIMRQNRVLERLACKTQDGTIGRKDPDADKMLEDDGMGVHVGDQVATHHYHTQPEAQESGLKSAITVVALLAAGAGAAALVPKLFDARPVPPAASAEDRDFELHIEKAADNRTSPPAQPRP